MKSKGYIKLNRKIFENKLWTKSRVLSEFEAWLDLIQSARFQETDTYERIGDRPVKYGRGEYPAARSFLAKKWGWGEQKVRTFLGDLKKQKMIEINSDQGISVIKLCNYEIYNSPKEPGNPQDNPYGNQRFGLIGNELAGLNNQSVTSAQPGANRNNNKDKEGNKSSTSLEGERGEEKTKRFQPPAIEEVEAYCRARDNHISGSEFVDFYTSKGWMVGKNKMKDWQAAVRSWEQNRKKEIKNEPNATNTGFRMHPSLRP